MKDTIIVLLLVVLAVILASGDRSPRSAIQDTTMSSVLPAQAITNHRGLGAHSQRPTVCLTLPPRNPLPLEDA